MADGFAARTVGPYVGKVSYGVRMVSDCVGMVSDTVEKVSDGVGKASGFSVGQIFGFLNIFEYIYINIFIRLHTREFFPKEIYSNIHF